MVDVRALCAKLALAQPVHIVDVVVDRTSVLHVETVGAEIDGSKRVGKIAVAHVV